MGDTVNSGDSTGYHRMNTIEELTTTTVNTGMYYTIAIASDGYLFIEQASSQHMAILIANSMHCTNQEYPTEERDDIFISEA